MKVVSYSYPHSSFLAVEKDMNLIVNQFLKNERLKRLLWYDAPDALVPGTDFKNSGHEHRIGTGWRNVNTEEAFQLFGTQIKIVPKLYVDREHWCYINILFNNFQPNATNPQFRDNIIQFDIICHFDQWNMGDFQLRPYKIAAEIDSMFNNKKLTGIGDTQFRGANRIVLNNEFAGISLKYTAMHSYEGEDNKQAFTPMEQDSIVENYNAIFNDPNVL